MRGDDERRVDLRRDQSGGDEEVRPDHVRACSRRAPAPQLEEASLAAGPPVEHGQLDLVPARAERALALGDECAEIGVVRPRVHLRDERGCASRSAPRQRGTRSRSYSPHSSRRTPQISPTVHRARKRLAHRQRAGSPSPRAASRTRLERSRRRRGVPLGAHPRAFARPGGARRPDRSGAARSAPRSGTAYTLTPTIARSPDSTCCCQRNAAASISPCTNPCSIAATAPPSSSTRSISSQRARLELVGQRLDVVRAAERVGGRGRARLRLQDLLRAQRDRRGALGRQRERLVERVRVQRLRAAADRRQRLHRRRGRCCSRAAAPSASSRRSAHGSAARAPSGSSRRTARA